MVRPVSFFKSNMLWPLLLHLWTKENCVYSWIMVWDLLWNPTLIGSIESYYIIMGTIRIGNKAIVFGVSY